jgi:hypothetical protein
MQSLKMPYGLKQASMARIKAEYPNLDIVYRDGQWVTYKTGITWA